MSYGLDFFFEPAVRSQRVFEYLAARRRFAIDADNVVYEHPHTEVYFSIRHKAAGIEAGPVHQSCDGLIPLSPLCGRFPAHHRFCAPPRIRQCGDQEVGQGGDLGGTCASCRRHEKQSALRQAPIDKNRLKLFVWKILCRDELGELGDCEPLERRR